MNSTKFALLLTIFAFNSFALDSTLLTLTREHPYLKCEISASKVVMERKNGEIIMTKKVDVSFQNLEEAIESAYLEKRNTTDNEYLAYRASGEAFSLNVNEKVSRNLIHTLSDLCEVRNYK